MNFITTFEELEHLYEASEVPEVTKEKAEESKEEKEPDEEVDVELEPDTVQEDVQTVLCCESCGGILVEDNIDETTAKDGIINLDLECPYCEATGDYKLLGTLIPTGPEEEVAIDLEDDEVEGDEIEEDEDEAEDETKAEDEIEDEDGEDDEVAIEIEDDEATEDKAAEEAEPAE